MKSVCASALVLAVLVLTVDASAGQFKYRRFYRAGQLPYGVVAAQLTNSGNLDMIVSSYLDNTIGIMLGNGDGTFQKPRSFSVPVPAFVAVGDFNEDGKPDFVVSESAGTGAVSIYLGDGKGGFKLSKSYTAGTATIAVAVADFDGDGHLDVAVTNKGAPGSVMVFFGDGHGKLHKRATYKLDGGPYGIAAGDLNGDNQPDLAVALDTGGSVAVLLNDGTGKFAKPVTYDAGGGEAVDVKIADLRQNGKQDLVVGNASVGMVVLLNNGDGTFGPDNVYAPCKKTCVGIESVTVADFNLDGILDIAGVAHVGNGSLFYGKGDGTFKPAVPIHDSNQNDESGYSVTTGDFNNDGAPDLAIPIQDDGKVAIMINKQ